LYLILAFPGKVYFPMAEPYAMGYAQMYYYFG